MTATITYLPSYFLRRLDWPQREFIDLTNEPCPVEMALREATTETMQ